MSDSPDLVRDPVCEMRVRSGQHEAAHEGSRYAFCSLQCRERFLARPRLYVGVRRRPAPKEAGKKLIRRRRVLLGHPLAQAQAAALIAALREMMGVIDVECVEAPIVHGPYSRPARGEPQSHAGIGGIEITYDLLEATMAQLERRIADVGGRFGNGIGAKLGRDFIHYVEECELEDLESSAAPAARAR
jgi:YHS domain-containing protein